MEVHRAEPVQLEREARRVRPHLILCSQEIEASVLREAGRPVFWVVLYSDGEDRLEVVKVGGECTSVLSGGVGVADLLRVVDETDLSFRSAQPAQFSNSAVQHFSKNKKPTG